MGCARCGQGHGLCDCVTTKISWGILSLGLIGLGTIGTAGIIVLGYLLAKALGSDP
ncbi:MAG TPA: hypothetical protein VF950_22655 [Planctomycetota bacterium]